MQFFENLIPQLLLQQIISITPFDVNLSDVNLKIVIAAELLQKMFYVSFPFFATEKVQHSQLPGALLWLW